jgi:hypothetical protein
MKVMCMQSPVEWTIIAAIYGGSVPQVGDECTVKDTRRCNCGEHDVYEFEEFNLHTGFQTDCFGILPSSTADEINAAEQEAIVPNPQLVESDALSVEEKALKAYYQTYEITGDERRAADVYFQMLNNPMP